MSVIDIDLFFNVVLYVSMASLVNAERLCGEI